MARIEVEDMALLEDEVSQLRSQNEYLRIQLDGMTHEHQSELASAWDDGWYASGTDVPWDPSLNPYRQP